MKKNRKTTKEEILKKHFKKEYGFEPRQKDMKGFKYVLDAMEEFAKQSQ